MGLIESCANGCGYECASCGRRVTCRDRDPSPAEVDHVCAECFYEEDPDAPRVA